MYINETNAHERCVISDAVSDIFYRVERARFILSDMLGEYFEKATPAPLDEEHAERLSNYLYTVSDMLFDALLEYHLTLGDADWQGVEPHMSGYKRASNAMRVNAAERKIHNAMRGMEKQKAAALLDAFWGLQELPDEQAAPAME